MTKTNVLGRILRPVGAVVFGAALMALAGCGQKQAEPGDVAVDFFTAFFSGDAEKAFNDSYIPEKFSNNPEEVNVIKKTFQEKSAEIQGQIESQGGVKTITVKQVYEPTTSPEGYEVRVVELEITTNDGKTLSQSGPVIKTPQGWKMKIDNEERPHRPPVPEPPPGVEPGSRPGPGPEGGPGPGFGPGPRPGPEGGPGPGPRPEPGPGPGPEAGPAPEAEAASQQN